MILPARGPGAFLRYRRPAVRDLAWLVLDGALRLPPESGLLPSVDLDESERAEFMELLQVWDTDPHDRWLGAVDPNLRLGLYTERLIGAWLGHSRQIRLLAQNWPLRASRITLGEADFLVQRKGREGLQLWELACKFYLGVPEHGWIGPGLNDSLAAKLARMRTHQLQLIHQPGFRAAWAGDWSARAWLAGWLLAPVASSSGTSSEPVASAARIAGLWTEAVDPSLLQAQALADDLGVSQWWLLPKRRWLRPVFGDDPVLQCFNDLAEAAAFLSSPAAPRQRGTQHARPLMLAGVRWLQQPGRAAVAAESMRLMLVPSGWLGQAVAMAARLPAPAGT